MARFFKPLLGAVALAAATLTSTGAFAAYAYNAQITITAPKGSTAEAAAKNKSLPSGMKYSSCAADVSVSGISIKNPDFLQISVKYDAGKLADEIGDVYLILQDLSLPANAARVMAVSRPADAGSFGGTAALDIATAATAGALPTTTLPFLAAADNLGTGAQTETLFGGAIGLKGLNKGLWSATVIIANPGAALTAPADFSATATTTTSTVFLLDRPDTWAAHDTVVFELGSPFEIGTTSLFATDAAVMSPTCE